MRRTLELYCRPGFMSPGINEDSLPEIASVSADPDDPASSLRAAERVARAYCLAVRDRRAASPSRSPIWEHAGRGAARLIDALEAADAQGASRLLSRFFTSTLSWGMAPVLPERPSAETIRSHAARAADALVSLGRFAGLIPAASIEQAGPLHEQRVDESSIAELARATVAEARLDLSAPLVAGNRGYRLGSLVTTAEALRHAQTILLLRRIGIRSGDAVLEIGGGFGGAAVAAARAGQGRYLVLDLPWVGAVQGYVLILALGEDAVRLYGEEYARGQLVEIRPFWTISEIDRGDFDAVVNCNSLPEIGLETARGYVRRIADIRPRAFLSINQEARAPAGEGISQLRVLDLVREEPRLELVSRHLSWMEQGYVEEIFRSGSRDDAETIKNARPTRRPSITVVTGIFGGFDDLAPAPPGCDRALLLTDDQERRSGEEILGWTIVRTEGLTSEILPRGISSIGGAFESGRRNASVGSPRFRAKGPKCAPHLFGIEDDAVVWIDGIFRSSGKSLRSLVDLVPEGGLGAFPHQVWTCVYREAKYASMLRQYAGEPVARQAEHYREAGHPEDWGLWEHGVLVWRGAQRTIGLDWLGEICAWSCKDQLSLAPVLRRAGARATDLPGTVGRNRWFSCASKHRVDEQAGAPSKTEILRSILLSGA